MVGTAAGINRNPVSAGPGRAGEDTAKVPLAEVFEAGAVREPALAVHQNDGVIQGFRFKVREGMRGVPEARVER